MKYLKNLILVTVFTGVSLGIAGCPTSGGNTTPLVAAVSIPLDSSTLECPNQCFNPLTVTIQQGGTVTWTNDDGSIHTVVSGTTGGGLDGTFDSGLIISGSTFANQFDTVGTFPYLCQLHPWQTGTIIVEETNSGN